MNGKSKNSAQSRPDSDAAALRSAFITDALVARRKALSSEMAHAADEVHAYLRQRVMGESVGRPELVPWRK